MAISKPVTFRAGEVDLAGTLTLPDGSGRRPWALLLASWLPRGRDGDWDRAGHPAWFSPWADPRRVGLLARLASALADLGVATFRYDKRGCGASAGDWEASDLFTLIDDARDALGALRGRAELDLRRTAIVGHGEGAAIALSVAIGDPVVSAVTLVAPAARSLRDVWRRGVAQRGRAGVDHEHPAIAVLDRAGDELIERVEQGQAEMRLRLGGGWMTLSLRGWEQAIRTPSLALATMLHRSVTLVHGADDAWSHPDESRLLAEVLRGAGNHPRLEIISGAGHELAEADDATIGRLAADLADRIVPRDLPTVLLAIEEAGTSR
jgi:uncharacterized protein